MTAIGQFRELNGNEFQPLKNLIGKPNKYKDEIAAYLRNAEIIAAAPGIVRDMLTGELTGIEMRVYSDGQYVWRSETVYYFEKYDMELPEEFVRHIMKAEA